MKKLLPLLWLLAATLFSIPFQGCKEDSETPAPATNDSAVIGKWTADKETIFWRNPPRTEVITMAQSFTFQGNTVTQVRNGNTRTGTYVFNQQKMEILMSWSSVPYRVVSLSATELMLEDLTDQSFVVQIALKK
ncbi:hypothetical protein [Hymenobacter metallicola]|uniref:Lipocalin-like domain-containing protein n=1 Tax=Hymenobacter metallicola TaxID=2563114 RepID=A0A4Z0QH19_9BACT|nr:hypothetical protein [Hymenobacter metallicola]TGE27972.1 hypothetical protein E5K02_00470 [Hymenobacter metallicola]